MICVGSRTVLPHKSIIIRRQRAARIQCQAIGKETPRFARALRHEPVAVQVNMDDLDIACYGSWR